jgi:hypothetical protein
MFIEKEKKIRSEANSACSTHYKDRSKQTLILRTEKDQSDRLIPDIGKIKAKKMKWIKVKRLEFV